MINWTHEVDTEGHIHDVWVIDETLPHGLQCAPKVAPSVDKHTSRFAFDEAIDEWLDITTVSAEKRAPSLKARLTGDAIT